MDFKEIEGKEVLGGQARVLGKVCGIEFDTKNWKVTHFYLDVDNDAVEDLGLTKHHFGSIKVTIPVEIIDVINDSIILNETLDKLKTIVKLRP